MCIGIGCSAGGLEPVCEIFQHLREKTGAAFVVIPHLSAEYPSRFGHILQRFTDMPVHRVTDTVIMQPNNVYVLVEGKMMIVEDHVLRVRKRYSREIINKSIDIFFKSMARCYDENAVGVILSGMGTDGIEGIKAIEDRHGLVLVQDPESTDFNILPQTAIIRDDPHAVLPPPEIAKFLQRYLKTDKRMI
ncbi:chemotaxis protein CheB [Chitinophaga sancti]|uniref:protein-glutamate methylesterase n=1 Tax=Chitinophaga sancti TaxID=1004 RepID=A0A1K1SC28_9BACT|nr:chemotaxis protein CheB [Chitinophaga sancti]WQD63545.1 chemotaxis protein CheB [Chitinophaga sancti]WQG90829.1 chemotaxis protein CheB [Chitinophaga sancti]SFW81660.1 CheB methylesterase [Chitinophaga sancti]